MRKMYGWLITSIQSALILLSLVAIIMILIEGINRGFAISVVGFKNLIDLVSQYSVLFAATAVVITIQLSFSQLGATISEQEIRHKKEVNTETLKQCQFYLVDFQIAFKQLVQAPEYENIGWPIVWSGLKELTRQSLKESYPTFYENIVRAEGEMKMSSVTTLYKLDAFAALFIFGNLDKSLGRKVIGHMYCKQVTMLLGLIAYYRIETNSTLFANAVTLLHEWS